jgi:hypothetical protein
MEGMVALDLTYAEQQSIFARVENCCGDAPGVSKSSILDGITEMLTNPAVPGSITRAAGKMFYQLFA